jgi:hypothetical protein
MNRARGIPTAGKYQVTAEQVARVLDQHGQADAFVRRSMSRSGTRTRTQRTTRCCSPGIRCGSRRFTTPCRSFSTTNTARTGMRCRSGTQPGRGNSANGNGAGSLSVLGLTPIGCATPCSRSSRRSLTDMRVRSGLTSISTAWLLPGRTSAFYAGRSREWGSKGVVWAVDCAPARDGALGDVESRPDR